MLLSTAQAEDYSKNTVLYDYEAQAELGTRQLYSFATTTKRQRDNVIEPQGPEIVRKIFRSRCFGGVATTNIVLLQ